MLSVGRSFRSNYSTSSFSSNFPRADSIHSNLKFILHSLHHPPTTLFLTRNAMFCIPCLHLPMWWRWFSTISSIWKGAKPFKATLPCRTHTYKHKLAQKESERERERERLVYQVLGFPLPFFCKHSHLCTEKNDLIAPSITKKMFIYTEMIKSNSSVFPSTSSLAHRLSIVPRMSTTLFFAYAQSILAGKIFLSFHWSEVHSKYAQGSG